MQSEPKKKGHIVWYILYGILLTVTFLYYLFPSDAFRDYFQATAEKLDPRLSLKIAKVSPSFLGGLKLSQTQLTLREKTSGTLFVADSLLIRPALWSFMQRKYQYLINARAYQGDLNGRVHFDENRTKAPFTASLDLEGIRLDNHPHLSALIGRKVSGTLGGTVSYSGQSRAFIMGAGQADLRLSKGQLEILQPLLGLSSISFDELRIRMGLENQSLQSIQVELKGPEIQGSLSGSIALSMKISDSRLDLKGTIEPFAALFKGEKGASDNLNILRQRLKRGKLSFTIQGTLASPKIRFV